MFNSAKLKFQEADGVDEGLGPRFNLDSCAGCHAAPAVGGSSPAVNPQFAVAVKDGARNTIPPFLSLNGPVREVRFKINPDGSRDGGVHALFVITGRSDAPTGCNITQENFSNTANLSFRIPTPTFGLGLVEAIHDQTIRENLSMNTDAKIRLGISGRVNTNGNDGTVTRFGWKAQNKSLAIFAGEAYNVEQGITNELFPNEREENSGCAGNGNPEDHTNFTSGEMGDVLQFAIFMRFLDAPQPAPLTASAANGKELFSRIGCAYCHTPTMTSGKSSSDALSYKPLNLYSDLALHNMGLELADGIPQGNAGPAEFRTAPLWGIGKRLFFLHDGRARTLLEAIGAHQSRGSEANAVVDNFRVLTIPQKQDVLNFLRSL